MLHVRLREKRIIPAEDSFFIFKAPSYKLHSSNRMKKLLPKSGYDSSFFLFLLSLLSEPPFPLPQRFLGKHLESIPHKRGLDASRIAALHQRM